MRKSLAPEALRILISQFFLLDSKKLARSYGITGDVISMAFLFFTEARTRAAEQTKKTNYHLSAIMIKPVLHGATLDLIGFFKSNLSMFIPAISYDNAQSIRLFNGREDINVYRPPNQFFK